MDWTGCHFSPREQSTKDLCGCADPSNDRSGNTYDVCMWHTTRHLWLLYCLRCYTQ